MLPRILQFLSRARRAGSHRLLLAGLVGALGLGLLAACGPSSPRGSSGPSSPSGTSASETRAAALRVLDSLDRGAMQSASRLAQQRAYTRRVRTEQLAGRGRVTAFEEHVLQHDASGGTRVVRSDSSGLFDMGGFGRLAATEPGAPASNLTGKVVSEEPAFLSERNRHAYTYRLLPDTAFAGRTAQVVAIRARSSSDGDAQPLRRARLYVEKATGRLVGVRLHRVRRSMLFNEDTQLSVLLQPARGAAADSATDWLPAETRFETRLNLPLRPERQFRSTASYSYSSDTRS